MIKVHKVTGFNCSPSIKGSVYYIKLGKKNPVLLEVPHSLYMEITMYDLVSYYKDGNKIKLHKVYKEVDKGNIKYCNVKSKYITYKMS